MADLDKEEIAQKARILYNSIEEKALVYNAVANKLSEVHDNIPPGRAMELVRVCVLSKMGKTQKGMTEAIQDFTEIVEESL
jgi:hypothetical protein